MAKIKTLNVFVKGVEYRININCRTSGMFSCNIPEEICKPLNLNSKIEAETLTDLEKKIHQAVDKFKNANTVQETMIVINYKVSGDYCFGPDGELMISGYNNPYLSDSIFHSRHMLAFDFKIVIREVVDTVLHWHVARKGDPNSIFEDRKDEDPNKFYKSEPFRVMDNHVFVPYSEQAYQTLVRARDGLRQISSILYKLVKSDQQELLALLTAGNLLELKSKQ